MRKKMKRISTTFTLLMVVLCSIILSLTACSSGSETKENPLEFTSVTLQEDGNKYIVKLYPAEKTLEHFYFEIAKTLNGKEIDLSKEGEWKVSGQGIFGEGQQLLFEQGSTLNINKINDKLIKIRYNITQKREGSTLSKKGIYEGSFIED